MALNLPANLIIEKNKIASPNPWLIFLDIILPDGTNLYFVRNTENVTFRGIDYQAVPFEIEPTKSSTKGEIPTVTLRVSNVTRLLQPYIEDLQGAVTSTVKITVANAAYLAEDYTELEMTFDVLSTEVTDQWVSFTLGAPNPLRKRFPLYRYIAEHCNWTFGSAECGLSIPGETCNRTFDDCRRLNNTKRFGGYKGLSSGNVRIIY